MRKLITAIAACLFIMGCAGTPQEKAADKMKDMQDDKTALVNKGVVAGLGIGTSKNKQLAYDEAKWTWKWPKTESTKFMPSPSWTPK